MGELANQVNSSDAKSIAMESGILSTHYRRSIAIYVGFIGWAATLGVFTVMWPTQSPVFGIAQSVPFIVLLIRWCQIDGARFGIEIGKWARIGLVFAFPVAMCVHFFRTRGIRGFVAILVAALFFFALCIVSSITMVLTSIVMYGKTLQLPL